MNRLILCCLLLLLSALPGMGQQLRHDWNINREWEFKLGDYPGAESPAYDDSSWSAINLPHSFSLPTFLSKDFYVGYGWYRKHFVLKPEWARKRVFVEFEGAFQDAEVYCNGTRVGEHEGGFTGFSMDVSPTVHTGDNVLAVRLNNNWNAQIEPRAGDHTFMGGIYRDVHLVVTDPLHVTWYGTFVTTPKVSQNSCMVDVKTEVENQDVVDKKCSVDTKIVDPDGRLVAHFASSRPIQAGETLTVDQTSPEIPQPKLWHPDHPFLYRAVTTILDGTTPVDDNTTTFGVRAIKWTADRGFFINGDHYYFHGANVHQDHAGWGDAITDAGAFRDVKLVKDAGLNFIRGSHYPHHPAFADACDKLGVLFWSENCFWGVGGWKGEGYWWASAYPTNAADQGPFEQNALDTLRDEIRIFRNHPSIVAWSMCNEVFFSADMEKTKGLLRKLVDLTHQLDPTRPAGIGGCQRGDLDKIGDVAGYNGDGATLPEFQNPGIPSVVTEYGSAISDRPGDYGGYFDPHAPEPVWRSGQALWCAFDYSTILGHFGCMGIVDYFRIPKRSWYWYRNEYRHIPPPEWSKEGQPAQLALTTDKTMIRGTDATDDCQILVRVQDQNGKPLSNSPPVTFTIESGPGEFPTGRSITFSPPSNDPQSDISIRDGQAAIEFRSYWGGKSVIRATSPGLKDDTLTIETIGAPVFVAGQSSLVPDRPYIRFVNDDLDDTVHNVALNHPVTSSGDAPGHSASLADDGNAGTFWQAQSSVPGAFWQVDLEALYAISSVELTFENPGHYQYKVEGSADGKAWTPLDDQSTTASMEMVRKDKCAANNQCRFLRVTFTGLPAGQPPHIAEIKVMAKK